MKKALSRLEYAFKNRFDAVDFGTSKQYSGTWRQKYSYKNIKKNSQRYFQSFWRIFGQKSWKPAQNLEKSAAYLAELADFLKSAKVG